MDYKTVKYKLPTEWSYALIYGDDQYMNEDDIRIMDEFLIAFDLIDKYCSDVADDAEFMKRPSYIHSSYELLNGDYSTFTFHIPKK